MTFWNIFIVHLTGRARQHFNHGFTVIRDKKNAIIENIIVIMRTLMKLSMLDKRLNLPYLRTRKKNVTHWISVFDISVQYENMKCNLPDLCSVELDDLRLISEQGWSFPNGQ